MLAKTGRTKYGHELDIRAQIDKESGYIGLDIERSSKTKEDSEEDTSENIKSIVTDLPKKKEIKDWRVSW